MYIEKNVRLDRANKKSILIDTFYSKKAKAQPLVIFCHGYKGFKDWGAWDLLAENIAQKGYCFVKFNFSHNGGTVENPIDFPDLEAFGNNNYSKELEDLEDVIDWTQKQFRTNSRINRNDITLVGHSRGGGITIIKAAEDRRVSRLITLASVSDFGTRTYTTGGLEEWKKTGVKYVINGRTKQKMPHYIQFYEDYKTNESRLNIKSSIKKLDIPVLIIHGTNDTSIKIDEANKLHQWYPKGELVKIEDADHVFNTKHPWDKNEMSDGLKKVSNAIITFLSNI